MKNYSNPYQSNQTPVANIQFKYNHNQPSYMGPSQLGYSNSPLQDSNNYKLNSNSFTTNQINGNLLFSNVAIVSKKANKVLDVCQDKNTKGMLIIYDDYK